MTCFCRWNDAALRWLVGTVTRPSTESQGQRSGGERAGTAISIAGLQYRRTSRNTACIVAYNPSWAHHISPLSTVTCSATRGIVTSVTQASRGKQRISSVNTMGNGVVSRSNDALQAILGLCSFPVANAPADQQQEAGNGGAWPVVLHRG